MEVEATHTSSGLKGLYAITPMWLMGGLMTSLQ